jgi:hypothetical protein
MKRILLISCFLLLAGCWKAEEELRIGNIDIHAETDEHSFSDSIEWDK